MARYVSASGAVILIDLEDLRIAVSKEPSLSEGVQADAFWIDQDRGCLCIGIKPSKRALSRTVIFSPRHAMKGKLKGEVEILADE